MYPKGLHVLLEEDGREVPGSSPAEHGAAPAVCQHGAEIPCHPECCHFPRWVLGGGPHVQKEKAVLLLFLSAWQSEAHVAESLPFTFIFCVYIMSSYMFKKKISSSSSGMICLSHLTRKDRFIFWLCAAWGLFQCPSCLCPLGSPGMWLSTSPEPKLLPVKAFALGCSPLTYWEHVLCSSSTFPKVCACCLFPLSCILRHILQAEVKPLTVWFWSAFTTREMFGFSLC